MEDIAQPLRFLFDWYDGVRDEYQQAREVAKQLERELDISRGASRALEGYIQDLRQDIAEAHQSFRESGERHSREMLQKQETLKYFTGVAAEELVTKVQLKEVEARLAAAEADVEHFRNQALRALAMAVNPPVIPRTDNEEAARRLDIAHARIRVLEQERDEALDELEDYQTRHQNEW